MRRISALLALLALAAAPVWAQTPPDLEPLPEPPPPPAMSAEDAALEPQVTIKKREGETVEEYRINGRLYKVIVTPEHGVPYTLIDPRVVCAPGEAPRYEPITCGDYLNWRFNKAFAYRKA